MIIQQIMISHDDINKLQEKERILFINLSVFANELTMLQKLVAISISAPENKILRVAQNTQTLFFMKLFSGKIHEGWKVVRRDYYKSAISKDYHQYLSPKARNALDNLKDYFKKGNSLISFIRDKYAFHYEAAEIREMLANIPNDGHYPLYLAEEHTNCFYFCSHILTNYSLFRYIHPNSDFEALDKLFSDMLQTTEWFLDFIAEIILIIFRDKIGKDVTIEDVEIPDPPKINTLSLPYFVSK